MQKYVHKDVFPCLCNSLFLGTKLVYIINIITHPHIFILISLRLAHVRIPLVILGLG